METETNDKSPVIEVECVDKSMRGSICDNEQNEVVDEFGQPYSRAIAYFKLILTKKMAPLDKLLSLQKGW